MKKVWMIISGVFFFIIGILTLKNHRLKRAKLKIEGELAKSALKKAKEDAKKERESVREEIIEDVVDSNSSGSDRLMQRDRERAKARTTKSDARAAKRRTLPRRRR